MAEFVFLADRTDSLADLAAPVVAIAFIRSHLSSRRSPRFAASVVVHNASIRGGTRQDDVARSVNEGLAWGLGAGLIARRYDGSNYDSMMITRLAERLYSSGALDSYLPACGLNRDDLHPRVAEACWDSVCSAKYDVAVFEAFRALEEIVKNAVPECSGKNGVEVFNVAFNADRGALRDERILDLNERKSWRDLFVGAYGAFRNPPAHRSGTKSDTAAVREELMLASLLMRQLEERGVTSPRPPAPPAP